MSTGKKTVLIVDDEYLIRKSLSINLKKANFEILEVDKGNSAIDMIASHEIDLVLCDLSLPDIDGIELIKIIKNKRKNLPVLAFSGFGNEEVKNSVLEAGASGYLEKPILKENLLSSIHKVLTSEKKQ